MNSKSIRPYDDDFKKEKGHCPTILKCGCPRGQISVPATTPTPPLILATVGVNFPNCRKPCVKIEYASNIEFVADEGGATIDITVTIFKNCTNNLRIPIGSYRYRRVGLPGFFGSTDTFSFFVCDCSTCHPNECCYYSAEITTSAVTGTVVTVDGAALSAIIASSGCTC